jgi:hypothetical protein
MTVPAAQAQKFFEQAATEKRVFTFLDNGSFLVFKVRDVEGRTVLVEQQAS